MGTFNSTDQDLSIYLPYYDVEITSRKTELPSVKLVKIYEKKVHISGTLEIDERFSKIKNVGFENDITKQIIKKFNELKKSDPSYGNIGGVDDYEYQGTKHIKVEDFFDYLKVENREQIINNII